MKPRDYMIWKSPVGNDVHIWEIKAVHDVRAGSALARLPLRFGGSRP